MRFTTCLSQPRPGIVKRNWYRFENRCQPSIAGSHQNAATEAMKGTRTEARVYPYTLNRKGTRLKQRYNPTPYTLNRGRARGPKQCVTGYGAGTGQLPRLGVFKQMQILGGGFLIAPLAAANASPARVRVHFQGAPTARRPVHTLADHLCAAGTSGESGRKAYCQNMPAAPPARPSDSLEPWAHPQPGPSPGKSVCSGPASLGHSGHAKNTLPILA